MPEGIARTESEDLLAAVPAVVASAETPGIVPAVVIARARVTTAAKAPVDSRRSIVDRLGVVGRLVVGGLVDDRAAVVAGVVSPATALGRCAGSHTP